MIFNSLTFFYFFLLLFLINNLLPMRWRNAWILAGGFIFYMSWSPIYILLLMVTALFDYFFALKIASLNSQAQRKPWLILSLVLNLSSLAFFKYTTMFFATLGDLSTWFHLGFKPPLFEVALPLGISFYTFETISYTVDVYRGELKPKKSFFEYLNFLMFFPKLIAGPIVRASELLHQIPKNRECTRAGFQEGLNLLFIGFAKKVLLADNFAPFVERVYASPSSYNRWMCIVAVYGYSMQVYFDFSAYSDIARGCAKLLGYDLPINFNKPYYATSIADFWRRWHMTLSRWLRDYLYIPLGGNAKGPVRTYFNLFTTMLLGGLWHGANWTFVAWGALNGSFLLIERAWFHLRKKKPKKPEAMSWLEKLGRGIIVFHLITFTRIFFRSPNFKVAVEMIKTILHPQNFTAHYDFALFLIPLATVGYIGVAKYRSLWMGFEPRGWRLAVYGLILSILLIFGATNAEFIYFQF